MLSTLKEKVVIITGGGGGIGRATALALAGEGCRIALCGGKNLDKLRQTVEQVRDAGATVIAFPGDLTDQPFLSTCIDRVFQHYQAVDVLINNAGMALNTPFAETSAAQLDQLYTINVKVPFMLCQQALPYLRQAEKPAIVNIASVVAHKGYQGQAAYAATKHALLGFGKSLANEVYQEGIRVHTISPGGVYTDMVRIARPDLDPTGMILPEEVAETIVFLLRQSGNAVIDEIKIHRAGKAPYDD